VAIASSGKAGAQRVATHVAVAIASSGKAGAQRVATHVAVAIASSGKAGAQRVATILLRQRPAVPDAWRRGKPHTSPSGRYPQFGEKQALLSPGSV
jgi:type IV pilus biogenesis protein CpaD/CtpE